MGYALGTPTLAIKGLGGSGQRVGLHPGAPPSLQSGAWVGWAFSGVCTRPSTSAIKSPGSDLSVCCALGCPSTSFCCQRPGWGRSASGVCTGSPTSAIKRLGGSCLSVGCAPCPPPLLRSRAWVESGLPEGYARGAPISAVRSPEGGRACQWGKSDMRRGLGSPLDLTCRGA